ncbi:MAG TPA: hypothetical protein VJ577_18005 [Burkholderiaceae bacterium]|nr:hypothetical protein [Burkholderiaceae bacterium]
MFDHIAIKFPTSALFLALALTIAEPQPCAARPKICSPQAAQAADAAMDNLDDWRKVARAFRDYGQCDDGSIAEGYSEAIARLLVDKWNTLPTLATLTRRDPALLQFVISHIDTTLDTADLEKIRQFAASKCDTTASLCSQLQAAAEQALR